MTKKKTTKKKAAKKKPPKTTAQKKAARKTRYRDESTSEERRKAEQAAIQYNEIIPNDFWEQHCTLAKKCLKKGWKPNYDTPDELWQSACEYFYWVAHNPIRLPAQPRSMYSRVKPHHDGVVTRIMSIEGLCNYLWIVPESFWLYHANDGFNFITSRIINIINQNKFELAAAGLASSAIVARSLGLIKGPEALFSANPYERRNAEYDQENMATTNEWVVQPVRSLYELDHQDIAEGELVEETEEDEPQADVVRQLKVIGE